MENTIVLILWSGNSVVLHKCRIVNDIETDIIHPFVGTSHKWLETENLITIVWGRSDRVGISDRIFVTRCSAWTLTIATEELTVSISSHRVEEDRHQLTHLIVEQLISWSSTLCEVLEIFLSVVHFIQRSVGWIAICIVDPFSWSGCSTRSDLNGSSWDRSELSQTIDRCLINATEPSIIVNPIRLDRLDLWAINRNRLQIIVCDGRSERKGLSSWWNIDKDIVALNKVKESVADCHIIFLDDHALRVQETSTDRCWVESWPTDLLHTLYIDLIDVVVWGISENTLTFESRNSLCDLRHHNDLTTVGDDIAQGLTIDISRSWERFSIQRTPSNILLLVLEIIDTLIPKRRTTHHHVKSLTERVCVIEIITVRKLAIVRLWDLHALPFTRSGIELTFDGDQLCSNTRNMTAWEIVVTRCIVIEVHDIRRIRNRIIELHESELSIVQVQLREIVL